MVGATRVNSKPTTAQRLKYRFDNTMARGTPALIGLLAVITILAAVIFSLVIIGGHLFPAESNGHRPSAIRQIYRITSSVIKFSTFDKDGWWWTAVMFVNSIVGLFIVSALVGLLVQGFNAKMRELRKGRSFVAETGHTLILGWSEAVYPIVSELAIANESESRATVVILADEDKQKMDERLAEKVGSTGKMKVVCRSGSPIDMSDLQIANPNAAKSIIILSSSKDDPDLDVIKTLLALTAGPNRRPEPYHIVAEIEHAANLDVARIVGGSEASVIDRRRTVSRLMVQASRQSGIAMAYSELFDFGGDEIYFREDPALVGHTYGTALLHYEDCCAIGIRSDGVVKINPPASTPINAGDAIIAVAADDSILAAAGKGSATVDESRIVAAAPTPAPATKMLMLGWNTRARVVIDELAAYAVPGSTLTVVGPEEPITEQIEAGVSYETLQIEYVVGETTKRATLNGLDVSTHDAVLVMSPPDIKDAQKADARSLVTLLHLRDIAAITGKRVPIVSEMLDDRNRELAQVTKVDDVIVSEKIISLILAQISENKELSAVFDDLLDAAGSEIHIRDVGVYINGETNFATVVEAAKRRGETAIGYRSFAAHEDPTMQYGVKINPAKSATLAAAAGDRVIVLAED